MSNRKLTILGIVAVLMVIWAVVQSRISSRPRAQPDAPAYLIQGLELDPAHIGSIVLGVGERAVTLKQQGGRFVVLNKDNYPAKTSEISKLITSCLEVRIGELYTDDAANHKDLGVAEESARTVVKFFKPDSSLLTGVVIGEIGAEEKSTYVRLASSDKVYVAPAAPWIRDNAMEYIDPELVAVNREGIESVTVNSLSGQYTLKAKEDGKEVVLENIPAGKKLKSDEADRVFTALTNLRFSDVKKKSAESEKLAFDRQFVCKMKDSTVYTVKIAQKDDKTYVTCEADFMDKTPVTEREVLDANDAELKDKEAKLLAWDRTKEFSAKHQVWIYEVADFKAKHLTTKLSDLIEDEEKPKEAEKLEDPNAIKVGDPNAIKAEDPNAINAGDPNVFEWLNAEE
jgi:hypothetical protein